MRFIPILIASLSILWGCTVKPDRPSLEAPTETAAPSCQESCTKNEDCGDAGFCCLDAEKCGAENRCVECTTNADCGGGVCSAGSCVGCNKDSDCKSSADGKFCNPDTLSCVACLDDSACKDGERCNSAGQCTCGSSDQCTEKGLKLCRDEGCVCSDDSGCPTGAQKCMLGICIACSEDTHCTDGKNKCFAGGTLNAYCGCTANEQCAAGTQCDLMSGKCVACLKDADCAGSLGGEKCGASGSCVQCVEGKDCASGTCTEGVCGCTTADECTGANANNNLKWVCEP